MIYQSNASWTEIPDSDDQHTTREDAENICRLLLEDYGKPYGRPCSFRGTCLKTWVTEVKEQGDE